MRSWYAQGTRLRGGSDTPPKRLGKDELSPELHRALIPAARLCVIREDRLNSAWLQSQGSGIIWKCRIC